MEEIGETWRQDGTIIFTSTLGALHRVSSAGGQDQFLLELARNETTRDAPHFLPDGRHFLF
ncbi:MAG: hypothetical protein DMG57_40420 [Acidobacteria bacterium]|nr:MAG: hypothetical protein DMG57_40420 [Acidobacteriota bacterium]